MAIIVVQSCLIGCILVHGAIHIGGCTSVNRFLEGSSQHLHDAAQRAKRNISVKVCPDPSRMDCVDVNVFPFGVLLGQFLGQFPHKQNIGQLGLPIALPCTVLAFLFKENIIPIEASKGVHLGGGDDDSGVDIQQVLCQDSLQESKVSQVVHPKLKLEPLLGLLALVYKESCIEHEHIDVSKSIILLKLVHKRLDTIQISQIHLKDLNTTPRMNLMLFCLIFDLRFCLLHILQRSRGNCDRGAMFHE
mmetsp:Transcript_1552/g.5336  ORF Transcript_1552/g.5336 Transcript_1552/m.5336 type:complete len:247 (-) Transcript_1552:190-930(-)